MLFLNELEEVLELCRVEQLQQVQATLTYSPITDSSSPVLSFPVLSCCMVWAPLPRADSGDALPPAGFVLGLGSLPGAWVE